MKSIPKSNSRYSESNIGAIIIEGHVQGLSNARSLGELGIPVYVVDTTNCIARYSKYCSKFFRCPDFVNDSFAEFLIALARNESIKDWILLPSNDHAVMTISKHKDKLEQYYKVITPKLDILRNIFDKSRLLRKAEEIGVPIPKTYFFTSANDKLLNNLSYPVIIKGRFGLSFYKKNGKKAYTVGDEKAFKNQLIRMSESIDIEDMIIQELIPYDGHNKTISFTAFCINGDIKTYWMGIKLREHPSRFGTATMAESIYIEECLEQSRILLNSLNYTGVCEIEYLKDPTNSKYKLIEINARTWLWVGLAKACGVDYAKMIYQNLNDEVVDYPSQYDTGIRWKNYFTNSIMYLVERLKNETQTSNSRIKPRTIQAIFSKQDPVPSIAFILMIPTLFIKRT